MSKYGSLSVASLVFKRDDLSVVSDIHTLFNKLFAIKRGGSESFKNNESRFAAILSKFYSYLLSTRLCESLSAFLLLSNANVNNTCKILIIVAANG